MFKAIGIQKGRQDVASIFIFGIQKNVILNTSYRNDCFREIK